MNDYSSQGRDNTEGMVDVDFKNFATRLAAIMAVTAIFGLKAQQIENRTHGPVAEATATVLAERFQDIR